MEGAEGGSRALGPLVGEGGGVGMQCPLHFLPVQIQLHLHVSTRVVLPGEGVKGLGGGGDEAGAELVEEKRGGEGWS